MTATPLLDGQPWTERLFTGEWVPASHGGDVREPATGELLGRVGVASPEDVAIAAQCASAAQADWARQPYTVRAEVLRKTGDLWREHATELQQWLVREAGSVPRKAAREVYVAAEECHYAAGLTALATGCVLPTEHPRLSFSRRVPTGVVAVIAPFNFPVVLSIRSVAPALALGNAVLLKPDPRTAVSGGVMIARIFEEAGLPAGLLQVLPGGVDVGEAIVSDTHVSVISFTGSTPAGRKVGELAARHLKRAHLELGGNSALVVLEDADLDRAVQAGAKASFMHQGQVCMAAGRHLVHESLYERYVSSLAAVADGLTVGDPARVSVALGPLIDAGQRDRVHALVTDSIDAGAALLAGGTYQDLFYRPTVIGAVDRNTPAYAQEVFGPVAPVLPFGSLDEAAELAGAGEHGLVLSVLTSNALAGWSMAERVPAGVVHVNDQTIDDEVAAPFGGVLDSGNGARTGGLAALEAFTETQWVTLRQEIPLGH